jgi:epoxyqueuosine reductase
MKRTESEKIKGILEEQTSGIDLIEVIPLVNLHEACNYTLRLLKRGLIPESYHWTEKKTVEAYHLKNYGTWARSIIIAAKYYYTDERYPPDKAFGKIARFTWRNNYRYLVIKLEEAVERLAWEIGIPIRSKILSNYTSVPEKILFRYSGLADIGKNSVLIHEDIGSYFTVGEAITDLDVGFSEAGMLRPPDFSICAGCTNCIEACPTGAILSDGVLDIHRCFQYISENPVLMPVSYREKWGNRLYGCSTCIDVCPFNQNLEPSGEKHTQGYVGTGMDLVKFLGLSREKFTEIFSHNQIGIRDYRAIVKNALVSCGNLEYRKCLDLAGSYLNHTNHIIRAYAVWAIGRIGTKTAKKMLETRYKVETDSQVKKEFDPFL